MASRSIVQLNNEGKWLNVLGMQIKYLCTGDHTQGKHSSLLNTVPKGCGAPPHSHPWDEAFYVLKGCIELRIDDETYELSSGDYVLVPADHVHAFNGLSDEEGLMIAFESPSNADGFFQEINDSVRNLPEDLAKMPDIGKRHQVSFV